MLPCVRVAVFVIQFSTTPGWILWSSPTKGARQHPCIPAQMATIAPMSLLQCPLADCLGTYPWHILRLAMHRHRAPMRLPPQARAHYTLCSHYHLRSTPRCQGCSFRWRWAEGRFWHRSYEANPFSTTLVFDCCVAEAHEKNMLPGRINHSGRNATLIMWV